jgi:hypothetical protein
MNTVVKIQLRKIFIQYLLPGAIILMFPMLSAYGFSTVFDAGSIMQSDMYKAYMQMERDGNLPFSRSAMPWVLLKN